MELSYEEAYKEMEDILEELDKEDLTLGDSVEKFKKAMALYNHCNDLITKAEGQVKILLEEEKGKLSEEDFILE